MRAPEVVTTARRKPRESGLDTSNGLEFVQQRIGLFAKIIAFIALAFLIAGAVGALALQMTGSAGIPVPTSSVRGLVAHVAGLVLLISVWLLCRWRRFQLNALEWLDAMSLIGASSAWALFIEPPLVDAQGRSAGPGEQVYPLPPAATLT
jgi:hypothetical protein